MSIDAGSDIPVPMTASNIPLQHVSSTQDVFVLLSVKVHINFMTQHSLTRQCWLQTGYG